MTHSCLHSGTVDSHLGYDKHQSSAFWGKKCTKSASNQAALALLHPNLLLIVEGVSGLRGRQRGTLLLLNTNAYFISVGFCQESLKPQCKVTTVTMLAGWAVISISHCSSRRIATACAEFFYKWHLRVTFLRMSLPESSSHVLQVWCLKGHMGWHVVCHILLFARVILAN